MHAAVAKAIAGLPEPLACVAAVRRLHDLTAAIPGIGEPFGFECRLSAGAHPVDFGFAVSSAAAERVIGAAGGRPRGGAWEGLFAVAARLARDETLRAWVPFLFLEFDADVAGAGAPVPSLFAALDSPLSISPGRGPDLDAATEVVSAFRAGHADVVRHAHATLPPDARLLHVGVMCGRAEASVRLSVLLEGEAAPAYLGALGADAAAAAARAALDRFSPWLRLAQVDFDCGPPQGGRIGIGLPPDPSGRLGEALVAHAGASRTRVEALAEWRGRCGCDDDRPRRISHLKLVCTPEGVAEAKAYLEVGAAP